MHSSSSSSSPSFEGRKWSCNFEYAFRLPRFLYGHSCPATFGFSSVFTLWKSWTQPSPLNPSSSSLFPTPFLNPTSSFWCVQRSCNVVDGQGFYFCFLNWPSWCVSPLRTRDVTRISTCVGEYEPDLFHLFLHHPSTSNLSPPLPSSAFAHGPYHTVSSNLCSLSTSSECREHYFLVEEFLHANMTFDTHTRVWHGLISWCREVLDSF